ncbi:MAG: SGNH/GDSL hydrolase family protein [Nitrospirales bacterium]
MAVMSLFIVFGFFEVYVRITQTNVENFDIEMWRYARDVKRVSDIPGMGHEHVPNTSGVYMSVPVTINSVGWRDKEYSIEKPPNTLRIMMLGDSVTFGWGALPEGVTSYVLESLLNHGEGQRQYEVLNTGIGNTNTAMQTAYFLHEGFRYQPDVVVLNYFINDAEPTPSRRQSFLVEHSYAAVFLAGRVDVFMRSYFERGDWQAYYKNLYKPRQSGWKNAQLSLEQLVNFCRERNIKLMIVNYPELHQLASYPFQEVTDLIAKQAMKYNVPFLDLLPAVVNEAPRSLWVSSTDAHPNGKAGSLFATRLKRALASEFPSQFE